MKVTYTLAALFGLVAVTTATQSFLSTTEFDMTAVADAEANGSTCGGNCPSGTCTTCYCGTSKSIYSAATACSQYSGWSQGCCQCIISHESGGNLNAQLHDSNGSDDVGLW